MIDSFWLTFKSYTRATSPLRRYIDLVMHWQIKGKLLEDSNSGRRSYKFSEVDMKDIAPRGIKHERFTAHLTNVSRRFWALEWMKRRQHHFKYDPKTLRMPFIHDVDVSKEGSIRSYSSHLPTYTGFFTHVSSEMCFIMLIELGGIETRLRLPPGKLVFLGQLFNVRGSYQLSITRPPQRGFFLIYRDCEPAIIRFAKKYY